MVLRTLYALIFCWTISLHTPAFAQQVPQTAENTLTIKTSRNGTNTVVIQDQAIKYVVVEATSMGNISHPVSIQVDGPKGMRAELEVTQQIGGGSGKKKGKRKKGKNKKKKKRGKTKKKKKKKNSSATPRLPTNPFDTPFDLPIPGFLQEANNKSYRVKFFTATGKPSPVLGASETLSQADKERLLQEILGTQNIDLVKGLLPGNTLDEILEQLLGTAARTNGLVGNGIIHKDSCNRKAKRYDQKLIIDLTGIDSTKEVGGYELEITLTNHKPDSKNETLVKESDTDRRNPLVLMRTNSFVGGNVEFYRWGRKSKPKLVKKFSVDKIFFHHLYGAMANVDTSSIASSKKATATRIDAGGTSAYSVCLTPSKRRQELNGYRR